MVLGFFQWAKGCKCRPTLLATEKAKEIQVS
jgi:hypothetical protein